MKKYLIALFIIFSPLTANATCVGSYNLTVRPSATSVTVGNDIKFTVNFNSGLEFSTWSAEFSYDKNKMNYKSGDTNLIAVIDNSGPKTKTYTYTFKTKTTGSSSFTFKINELASLNEAKFICPGVKSATATVKVVPARELNSNNYLKSLVVENQNLNPNFNKNTNTYNLILPAGSQEININASKEHSRASVSGLGIHKLEEGDNTVNIIVTAENGATRVYTVNAFVIEKDPIIVKIDKDEYTMLRKDTDLADLKPDNFELSLEKYGEEEVSAFVNEKLKMTLFGLKDQTGKTFLYIYEDGNFKAFKALKSEASFLIIDEDAKVSNYKNAKLVIDDQQYNVYKNNDYYYFYATNSITAEKNLYRYEKTEKTTQIEILKETTELEENNIYFFIALALGTFLLITYLVIIINTFKKDKKDFIKEEKNDTIQSDDKLRKKK